MKKILVTRKLLKENEERISKIWNAKLNLNDKIYSQNELIELSKDCDGILSSIVDKIDEKTINKLSDKVKIISNFAVGFGNIDTKAAREKNIVVTNTPDVLTNATAEIAMLLILGAARRASEGIKWAKNKNCETNSTVGSKQRVMVKTHTHISHTKKKRENNAELFVNNIFKQMRL